MNAQITEDYVSFETAKLLKEKGFDADIDIWYDENGDAFFCHKYDISHNWRTRQKQEVYLRPTLQMARKWLRKVHNLHIVIEPLVAGNYVIYIDRISNKECIGSDITYEKACDAAIKYCLEYLVEINT